MSEVFEDTKKGLEEGVAHARGEDVALRVHHIKTVSNEAEYNAALKEVDSLMDAEADTTKGARFDSLLNAIRSYEARHYPMDAK